ncbi:MAG: hypothetical protein JWR60_1876 [Polaromonas sp.]|nr:hypothetical protein [Polaromonas sp.]
MRHLFSSRLPLRAALWLACVFMAGAAVAQPVLPQRESAVKAAFLFKFCAFIEWPAGVFKRGDEPLLIGIAGDDSLAADLEQLLAGRTLEGRPVKALRVGSSEPSAGLHVLFLAYRPDAALREAIAAVSGPVLVVTEQPGALRPGSVINFSTLAGRVRFSVSLGAAKTRSLKLSSRLLAVAQDVEEEAP